MPYRVVASKQFMRDLKKAKSRGLPLEELYKVVDLLRQGEKLPAKYKDHKLVGNKRGLRDCHISPDWLLLYSKDDGIQLVELARTGTHSDLFK